MYNFYFWISLRWLKVSVFQTIWELISRWSNRLGRLKVNTFIKESGFVDKRIILGFFPRKTVSLALQTVERCWRILASTCVTVVQICTKSPHHSTVMTKLSFYVAGNQRKPKRSWWQVVVNSCQYNTSICRQRGFLPKFTLDYRFICWSRYWLGHANWLIIYYIVLLRVIPLRPHLVGLWNCQEIVRWRKRIDEIRLTCVAIEGFLWTPDLPTQLLWDSIFVLQLEKFLEFISIPADV